MARGTPRSSLPELEIGIGLGEASQSSSFDSQSPVINPIPAIVFYGPGAIVTIAIAVFGG